MKTTVSHRLNAFVLGMAFSFAATSASWAAGHHVGAVKSVEPQATIAPAGKDPAVVTLNNGVSMADIVRTDVNGFVKIEFKDGSQLTVNPGSNVTIDQYVYDSSTNAGTLVMSVGSGVARFVSGKMKKEDIKIKTMTATMGLRG